MSDLAPPTAAERTFLAQAVIDAVGPAPKYFDVCFRAAIEGKAAVKTVIVPDWKWLCPLHHDAT